MAEDNRREALKKVAATAIAATALSQRPAGAQPASRLKFAVLGANHYHIFGQCDAVIRGGGELTSFMMDDPGIKAEFVRRYPHAREVTDERRILEDRHIKLVVSSAVPIDRAPIGVRVMQHGKDYMADKPGIITLDQLAEARRVQAETGRIYSICYSERFESKSTIKASELVAAGAIGDVVQTTGQGPHRIVDPSAAARGITGRPDWFWDPSKYGGIICDIGSHQVDQFLHFTGSTSAEVTGSQIANFHNGEHPQFQDFGDVMLRGDGGAGYFRVDWFTPQGLPTWGDGRFTIIGSAGYIELRKYIDIAGREGANHLFIVDNQGVRHVDCNDVALPYGPALVDDVLNRTDTAMTQEHCFLATELALKAQASAARVAG
jgi:predicted dehydrogenase